MKQLNIIRRWLISVAMTGFVIAQDIIEEGINIASIIEQDIDKILDDVNGQLTKEINRGSGPSKSHFALAELDEALKKLKTNFEKTAKLYMDLWENSLEISPKNSSTLSADKKYDYLMGIQKNIQLVDALINDNNSKEITEALDKIDFYQSYLSPKSLDYYDLITPLITNMLIDIQGVKPYDLAFKEQLDFKEQLTLDEIFNNMNIIQQLIERIKDIFGKSKFLNRLRQLKQQRVQQQESDFDEIDTAGATERGQQIDQEQQQRIATGKTSGTPNEQQKEFDISPDQEQTTNYDHAQEGMVEKVP